jgi:PBP1b-binding outer membrane lipoprotein LpoB
MINLKIRKMNRFSIGVLSVSFLLASCGGGNKSAKNEEAIAEKKEEIQTFVEREFTYPIPSAFEVYQMLENAQTEYLPSIPNDPSKVDEYIATWQKATNLGVYGADLSYAATFEKTQETIDFLDTSKKLIDDLNISTSFNTTMAERMEENLDNVDSLIFIVTESFYDTYNYLNQNGEEKTSILVIAGSVIEGLYIICELINASENNSELIGVLAAQKEQVAKLIELMENHQNDANVAKVLPDLRYINLVYDQLGEDTEMTEGQFNDIASSVRSMRAHIVG